MCITLTPPTLSKKNVMDISYFAREDDMGIVMPYPKGQSDKLDILLAPFQLKVNGSIN